MIREVRKYQKEEKDIAEEEEEDDEQEYKEEEDEDEEDGNDKETRRPVSPSHLFSTVEVVVREHGPVTGYHDHPKPGVLKHSLSTVTDPGVYVDNPVLSLFIYCISRLVLY